MYAAGQLYPILTDVEIGRIYNGAMRILSEMGMEIQNQNLLEDLAQFGFQVDFAAQRVRFPTVKVEEYIAGSQKYDWTQHRPAVGGSAGVYHSLYHDPMRGELLPWDEKKLAGYFSLAGRQSHISGALMLGNRLPDPTALEPLYERYYCWKYGAQEGSSIYTDELCPYLLELYEVRAAALGMRLDEVFRGTVYLVPSLKLGAHEAYQVDYFRKRGLRVGIGGMLALGSSAPVTLAGAVTLNMAEQLALQLVNWAWFGIRRLSLGGSISVLDMRTMIYPYGRPEMAIANMLTAQLARALGAEFHGHAGLSDAKLPSVEAGYQKALTAIPTLMTSGSLWMDAGLLATDEVCSPVQLILDNEFLSALSHFTQSIAVDDEAIGLDMILGVGPGGSYLVEEHTVKHLRQKAQWQPRVWSRQMLGAWLDSGRMLDADRAREMALDLLNQPNLGDGMDEAQERAVLGVIEKAGQAVKSP